MNENETIEKYFKNCGFGQHKETARFLLENTIKLLDEFNVNYFLISGTLLGYVRHNDFIPWDDDIDLIVDSSFVTKLEEIKNKTFLQISYFCGFYKVSNMEGVHHFERKNSIYNWPFVDLFIYEQDDYYIHFFGKRWEKKYFFPSQTVNFLNISSKIP